MAWNISLSVCGGLAFGFDFLADIMPQNKGALIFKKLFEEPELVQGASDCALDFVDLVLQAAILREPSLGP